MWNLILASIQVSPTKSPSNYYADILTFMQAIIQVMTVVILGFIFAKAGHFNMDKQKVKKKKKLATKGQGIDDSDKSPSNVSSGFPNLT